MLDLNTSAKAELAREFFRQGANCAQAVALAFADDCDKSREELARLASGFGAGIGRMREVCGAVSGMVLVADLLWGPEDIADKAGKDTQYSRIQSLAEKFRAETGSIVCRELLGLAPKQSDPPVSEARTENYYKKRPCVEMVALAAAILEEALAEK